MSSPFGNPPSTGGSSLFGQTSNNSNSNNNNNTQQSSNQFGGGGSKSLFGSAATQDQGQSPSAQSPFGTAQSGSSGGFSFGKKDTSGNQSNPFGSFSTPSKDSSQAQGSSLFGQQSSSAQNGSSTPTAAKPSLFGSNNTSTTPAGPPPTNLFGNLGQGPKSNNSLFGSTPQNNQSTDQSAQKSSSNLFGSVSSASNTGSTPLSAAPSSSLFGKQSDSSNTETPKEAPKFSFGNLGGGTEASKNQAQSAPAGQSGFKIPSFGQNAQGSNQGPSETNAAAKPNPFTGASASNTGGPSLFGNTSEKQNTNQSGGSGPTSLFGNTAQNKDGQETSSPASALFGNLNQKKDGQETSTSSASLFGNAGHNKDDNAAQQQTPSLFEQKQQQQGGSSSTGDGTQAAPPKFAPSSFFSQDNGKDKDKSGEAAKSQETSSTSAPAPSIAPAGGLFGGNASKPAQDTSTKPAESSSTTGTLGASTAGPVPATQSRLKNKSMDEIITRWASDLSKYQKEFQAQAEKVAAWDRMLIENGNAISKLYSKTFQAERDTAEVQKQLSAVESHQDELSHWLDRYEREVDEMMARQVGQGEGMQGPDQERERTYKIAERVSERLDEMGKDLTSMIEEINDASATISKTSRPDDPVSHRNSPVRRLQLTGVSFHKSFGS